MLVSFSTKSISKSNFINSSAYKVLGDESQRRIYDQFAHDPSPENNNRN